MQFLSDPGVPLSHLLAEQAGFQKLKWGKAGEGPGLGEKTGDGSGRQRRQEGGLTGNRGP